MATITRRDAIRAGIALTATPTLASGLGVLSGLTQFASASAGPSGDEPIRIGLVGMGIRARELLGQFTDAPCRVVGICEVVDVRREDGIRRVNEKLGAGTCRGYTDYRELVARSDIDAVVVTTPDHWHALPAIAAAKAKKHVYCEKPLTLTVREGRAVATAARATGIVFQTGSQQRSEFDRRFVKAVECVRNGRIGRVQRVEVGVGEPPKPYDLTPQPLPPGIDWDMWCGPSPLVGYHPDLCPPDVHGFYPKWRAYREFANGFYADMGAHHFDIVQWALDKDTSGPVRIEPPAAPADHGLRYVYTNGPDETEVIHGGSIDCHFQGTDGWIKVSRGSLEASKKDILDAPFAEGDWRAANPPSHIANWVAAIRTCTPTLCPAETGHRSATVCQLATIAYQLRVPLTWDPEAEWFSGEHADVANPLLERTPRG